MSLSVAVPRESRTGERRVALDPASAARLAELPGVTLRVETGCGRRAGFDDSAYASASVFRSFAETVREADVIVKVTAPTVEEAGELPESSVLVAPMGAFQHLDVVDVLCQRNITTLALDLLPRITRAQSMDVLSSQATVVGYKAALLAAELTPRLFPRLTTAAGTLKPAQVVIIGAGVAGLQAIATSRRLGADVEAYDIRRAAKEQIESLGARMIDTGVEAESTGGYARALTVDERGSQHDTLAKHLAAAHAVICTAAIPGQPAPRIISEDMVAGMMPHSVIIDASADTGGNCELTRPGETVNFQDVTIVGPVNLQSSSALDASEMFGRNCLHMLLHLLPDGSLNLDWEDRIIRGCRLTHDHRIWHTPTVRLMQHSGFASVPAVLEDAKDGPPEDEETPSTADPATGWLTEESGDEATEAAEAAEAAEADTAAGKTRPLTDTTHPPVVDDLTRIRGIGPAMQQQLNAFGIYRYRQLAALDDRSIERLEKQLEIEPRILAEDWPGQARRLERSL